jgi:putative adenylate-forming enzyme
MRFWRLFSAFVGARWRFRRLRGAALQRYQDLRAQQAVAFAVRHAPFYRDHFAGHDVARWTTLPTVDKAQMMAHFDTFNTRGVPLATAMAVALQAESNRDFRPTLAGLTVGLSSGTSGHRGLFLVSPGEQAAWAGTILGRTLPGFRRRGYRVAFFLRSNSNLYESVGDRCIRFRYFDLMTPLEHAIPALNAEPPDFLAGPPSLLSLLADAQQAGTLRIRPQRLLSVAEVLEPQDEQRLAAIFGAPVHQIYQCTEGLLAVSCAHGRLHLQEDVVAIQLEPLAEDAEDQGFAKRWTPVVTDLWRRTQPIIRYRLNDVVSLDNRPCPCGSAFRVLARIEGRCDDVCYFERLSGGLRPFFPDTIRRLVLLSSSHISDYQAFQKRAGHLRVHVETAANHADEVVQSVRECVAATVAQYDCRPPTTEVVLGLVPLTAGSKRRRVQRLG